MGILYLAILICAGHEYVHTLSLPDYIKPCPRNDPDFNACALKNGREAASFVIKGDPKYGIPVLDPWYLEDVTAREAGLSLSAKNFTVEGFSKGQLESFKADFEHMNVTLDYRVPELNFRGNYSIKGNLVAIPINGFGPFVSTMYDVVLRYSTKFKTETKDDGKEYGTPVDYDMMLIPTDMKFVLHNLFGSNKQVNDAINKFFNANWRIVMQEAGRPVTRLMGRDFHKILIDLGEKIPLSEVFSN